MEYSRESVFVSAIRTLCKTFAGVIGILVGIIVVCFVLMMFSSHDIYPPKSTLTISPDAKGNREFLHSSAPVILKIDIDGVIGLGDLTYKKIQSSLLDSREGLLAQNRVKALLLYIDSPGGSADDADDIYRAILSYKKKYQVPVYAFVDGMCASGGMYIACAADRIFSTPTSVIGSVGVLLGPTFNFSGLMERYGVQSLSLTQGKDKDMLNPFRPWVPGEDKSLVKITSDLYNRFVDIVVEARPRLTRDKLVDELGAQVYSPEDALQLGYIDVADSDYDVAVDELAKAAQIPETEKYQVLTITPMHTFLSQFGDNQPSLLQGKITHHFQIGSMNSELSGRFLYLYQP